jgi:hypothetical protein
MTDISKIRNFSIIALKPGGICPAASFEKSITVGWPAPACSPQPQ